MFTRHTLMQLLTSWINSSQTLLGHTVGFNTRLFLSRLVSDSQWETRRVSHPLSRDTALQNIPLTPQLVSLPLGRQDRRGQRYRQDTDPRTTLVASAFSKVLLQTTLSRRASAAMKAQLMTPESSQRHGGQSETLGQGWNQTAGT